ncbi:response regulator [Streptomyces canus]|uniref:response regulator n=1 Tax=Streptomyces canus TaxID=58343 RepID=UPI0038188930
MSKHESSKIQVLLTDGDIPFRQTLAELLALDAQLQVAAGAVSGPEILELAHQYRTDVLIISLPLPGVPVLSVISALRADLPTCATVVLAADMGASLKDYLSAGARAVAHKGTSGHEITKIVHTVHAGGRYVDQEYLNDAISCNYSSMS